MIWENESSAGVFASIQDELPCVADRIKSDLNYGNEKKISERDHYFVCACGDSRCWILFLEKVSFRSDRLSNCRSCSRRRDTSHHSQWPNKPSNDRAGRKSNFGNSPKDLCGFQFPGN